MRTTSFTFHPACPQYGQRPVRFDSASADEKYAVPIVEGEPVVDRKSTFKAYLATGVDSDEKVQWARRNILGRKNVAKATHNMLAYRYLDENGISHADNDDDGEDGAGAKMAYVLSVLNADNCLVIVARWYGGIKLGPDRFKCFALCPNCEHVFYVANGDLTDANRKSAMPQLTAERKRHGGEFNRRHHRHGQLRRAG